MKTEYFRGNADATVKDRNQGDETKMPANYHSLADAINDIAAKLNDTTLLADTHPIAFIKAVAGKIDTLTAKYQRLLKAATTVLDNTAEPFNYIQMLIDAVREAEETK
jgi:hypothetical protein